MSLKIFEDLEQGTTAWLEVVTTSTEGGAVIIDDGQVQA